MMQRMGIGLSLGCLLLLSGCLNKDVPAIVNTSEIKPVIVRILDTGGKEVGQATLTQKEEGVHIKAEARGLTPGFHGFHIHEKGVCEAPSFESAGGHFNPHNSHHGFLDSAGPHAGDLPNLFVDASGTGTFEWTSNRVTLQQGKGNSLLADSGTALVIHTGSDDYLSDPSGDAGSRAACGVISSPSH